MAWIVHDFKVGKMTKQEKTDFAEIKEKLEKIMNAKEKKHEDDCPHCGRCKHCGRSDQLTYYPIPYYPQPWPRPYWYVDYTNPPYVTYTDNKDTGTLKWTGTSGGTFESNSSSTILLNDGRGQ